LRKGLSPIALKFSGLGATVSKNAVDFGVHSTHNVVGAHTWACWFWMKDGASTAPLISKTDVDFSGNDSNDIFMYGTGDNDQLFVRRAFDNNGSINAGVWTSPTGTLTGLENAWHHVAMVYDDSSIGNDPVLYLDGVSLTLHEADTPEGTPSDYSGANLLIGNLNVVGSELQYAYNGFIKDARIYNRLLSPNEVAVLASDNDNYLLVPDGLVFQAPNVKTEDYGGMTGTVILPTNKLIDNTYGIRGTATANYPSGTAWAILAYDPNF